MGIRLRWALILALVFVLALAGRFALVRWQKSKLNQYSLRAEVIHLACGHPGTMREMDRTVLSRLARSKAGVSIQGWRLLAKEGQAMRVVYEDRRPCPACRKARFLGVTGGFIAVFSGTPSNPGSTLELTKIKADDLPEPELLDLRRGIPFSNEKERLQLLEGLTALLHE